MTLYFILTQKNQARLHGVCVCKILYSNVMTEPIPEISLIGNP